MIRTEGGAALTRDGREAFQARPADGVAWEVWDISHPATCNHFPVIRVDSKGASDDFHERYARACAAALAQPVEAGEGYAEAFDILVDVQSALVLTADHSQGATVASFVSSSTQYDRLNRFLHDRQYSNPRTGTRP